MFDKDLWQEVFYILKKNKTRTILTGFGVFWGIFMLVVLLGAGKGLYNGAFYGLGDLALNSLYMWTRPTSIPHMGFDRGRYWSFTNEDTIAIREGIDEIDILAPRYQNPRGRQEISRNKRSDMFQIIGDTPEYARIQPQDITAGRFMNEMDITNRRKVVVLGKRVREVLFDPEEDPIGEYLKINGMYFQIVGTSESRRPPNRGGDRDNECIYMPFTTMQKVYNLGNKVGYYSMLAQPGVSAKKLEAKLKKFLARRHKVSPVDEQAFGVDNVEEEVKQMTNLFTGIFLLSWFVGAFTLIAGVIGTSNIMLVIVRERTKEIGVQRALGATPMRIIRQIVTESIFLNTIAGYAGLLLSTGLVELIGYILRKANIEGVFFHNPEVDLKVVTMALVILIFSGALAGLLPAQRAVSIKPIDAIRSEI